MPIARAVIAGQGTIGIEMLRARPDLDELVISVGGGGLISGIATAAKHLKPDIRLTGVEVERFALVLLLSKSSLISTSRSLSNSGNRDPFPWAPVKVLLLLFSSMALDTLLVRHIPSERFPSGHPLTVYPRSPDSTLPFQW